MAGYGTIASQHSTCSPSSSIATHKDMCFNVLFLITVDMESLTGPHAVRRAVSQVLTMRPGATATIVQLKVSMAGITLTDVKHRSVAVLAMHII